MEKQEKPLFEYDDWVGTVRSDPRNTEQLTVLQGFIGQSSESAHIRVYSDESLNSFVEVPEAAVVYARKLSSTESSLGGSKLWLRADTVITHGDPKLANRPKSTFLEGDIMQQHSAFAQPDTTLMQGFAGGQPDTTGPQAQAATLTIICGPVTTGASVCFICPPRKTLLQATCLRSVCVVQTCFRTICGFATCQVTFCGKTCFRTVCCVPTDRFTITPTTPQVGGVGNPAMQQGLGFMGDQPDTNQMGGYYGTFNPYLF